MCSKAQKTLLQSRMSLRRGHPTAANKQQSRGLSKRQFPNCLRGGELLLSSAGKSSEVLAVQAGFGNGILANTGMQSGLKCCSCGDHETQMTLGVSRRAWCV